MKLFWTFDHRPLISLWASLYSEHNSTRVESFWARVTIVARVYVRVGSHPEYACANLYNGTGNNIHGKTAIISSGTFATRYFKWYCIIIELILKFTIPIKYHVVDTYKAPIL